MENKNKETELKATLWEIDQQIERWTNKKNQVFQELVKVVQERQKKEEAEKLANAKKDKKAVPGEKNGGK